MRNTTKQNTAIALDPHLDSTSLAVGKGNNITFAKNRLAQGLLPAVIFVFRDTQ